MPTARSSTDDAPPGPVRALLPLIALRLAGTNRRTRVLLVVGLAALFATSVVAMVLPASLDLPPDLVDRTRTYLPVGLLAFLVTSTIAQVASGGGREIVPREQVVAFPIGPTTDHLGSLLLAPLNFAWLVQAWALLASVAVVTGARGVWAAELTALVWVGTATAIAQLVAWLVEIARSHRRGTWAVRGLALVGAAGLATAVTTGHLLTVARGAGGEPVIVVLRAAASGDLLVWATGLAGLVLLGVVAVGLGGVAAGRAVGSSPRAQASVETRTYRPRAWPGSDLRALVAVDRASVWRSAPLRRGLLLLAVLPVLIAFAGRLDWATVPMLPGLVASGAALLFGVNAWCLDARGALWRESLPVTPCVGLIARTQVLVEMVVVAEVASLVACGLRAGPPRPSELVAAVAAAAVVALRVVASSLRWSVRRPFAVDLRAVRATPAPPVVMLGYSLRLAVTATVTGLLFCALGQALPWTWSVATGAVLALTSIWSLLRTAAAWDRPDTRSAVVSTVAVA